MRTSPLSLLPAAELIEVFLLRAGVLEKPHFEAAILLILEDLPGPVYYLIAMGRTALRGFVLVWWTNLPFSMERLDLDFLRVLEDILSFSLLMIDRGDYAAD